MAIASNGTEFESEHSSRRSSPALSESDNNSINVAGEQLSSSSARGGLQKSSAFVGSPPEAGWAEQAVAANQQPTCEAGMFSPQNPTGTPLQGWDCDKADLFAFAHFNSMCEACEQVVRCSMSLEQSSCTSPAFLSSRERGRIGEAADGLICCNRPARERCYALEVLATLVQDEDWTLRGVPGRPAEYLDCLRFYLNQQFLKLVEQGKVLQCFDETGRAVWICFCTGLLSSKEESIFCVLQRNYAHPFEIGASWQYNCFATSRELQETKQPWNAVEPILNPPDKATFFDNHLDLLYAPSGQGENIQLDSQIWDDLEIHLLYFPKSLVKSGVTSQCPLPATEPVILKRITGSTCADSRLLSCQRDLLAYVEFLSQAQKQAVISALQRAVQMLQYNPFMAVPQFHGLSSKKSGALQETLLEGFSFDPDLYMQLLLPMKLDPDADATHLAFVLEISKSRRGGRMYRTTGMIALPQAYANARVLMPVCQRWLSRCAFTCDLISSISKGYTEKRQSRTATDHHKPTLSYEPKPRTTLSAPASFNIDESFSRNCFATSENWLCISRPSTISQKGGSLSSPLSFHTTPDSSSPISPSASGPYGTTPPLCIDPSTSSSSMSLPHHQVSSPRNHQLTGNMRRAFVDVYGERKSIKGTGVAFPLYADTVLQGSSAAALSRLPSFDETTSCNGRFDHCSFQGLSLSDMERLQASESQHVTSFSQGGESAKQTGSYSTMADLGGHTWGVSPVGPSLCPSISSEMNGGSLGSANDLPLGFIPATTMSPDYIAQSRQCAASSANCEMARLGPMGLFPSQTWSSLDLSAICGDFDGHRQDEYVEFTPADDACPKINISQLPPRFVADYLSGDLPGTEQAAELHTSQSFGRYGVVARSLVRENKNHSGKWFAIVEFSFWTDEAVRLQLIQGGQIRFPDFYGQEDVVFRRHKDKQKKQFCNQAATLSPSASCRPFWKYTGTDTRAGKPLFKGPCSKCGKESTVPFKPVVNGQPPRCRNCLPLQPAIPVTMATGLLLGQQSQILQHNLPFNLND